MSSNAGRIDAPHFGSVRQVLFDITGQHLLSLGEDDGSIFVWNAEDLSASTTNDISTKSGSVPVRAILFSVVTGEFAFAGENRKLVKTDWPECTTYSDIFESDHTIDHICENSETNTVAIAAGSDILMVTSSGTVETRINLENSVQWMGYSSSNSHFAAVDSKFYLKVWSAPQHTLILEEQLDAACALPTWGPNSVLIIEKGGDAGVYVAIDFASGGRRNELIIGGQRTMATAIAYSEQVACLAIADTSHCLRVVQFDSEWHRKDIFSDSFVGGMMRCLCWRGGCVAGGDEDGNVFRWADVVHADEPQGEIVAIGKKAKPEENASFLRPMTDKTVYVKPKSSVPKKAKSKAKQQTLDLKKITNTSAKVQSKIRLTSDEDSEDSSEEEEAEQAETPAQTRDFLGDEDDIDVDIDVDAVATAKQQETPKQREFLGSEDDDEATVTEEKEQKTFLPSDAEEPGAPDYADLVIPYGSDEELENEPVLSQHDEAVPEKLKPLDGGESSGPSIAFVPGSFPEYVNGRKWMCWNGFGTVFVEENLPKLQIVPSETSDFFAKSITVDDVVSATVDEKGYIYATRDSLIYHKHGRYGPESEIVKNFSIADSVELLATGATWFAAATSMNRLHIFTSAGLPLTVIALDGRCITIVGQEDFLLVVYGNNHKFEIFDVPNESSIAKGFLPIKSPLRWAGFDLETNEVVVEGGDFVFQKLSREFGTRWTPVLDLKEHCVDGITGFYPVNVEDNTLRAIHLRKGALAPDVLPTRAIYDELPFAPLSVNAQHAGAIQALLRYTTARKNGDTENAALALDKELLILFSRALEQNRLLLAVQVASRMKTGKGRALALRRTDQTGQKLVADRLRKIFEDEDYSDSYSESDEESEPPPPFVRTQKQEEEEEPEQEAAPEPEPEPEPEQEDVEEEEEAEQVEKESEESEEAPPKKQRRQQKRNEESEEQPKPKRQRKPASNSRKKKTVPISQLTSLAQFGFT